MPRKPWLLYDEDSLAPLRRKSSGSITTKTKWLHYGDDSQLGTCLNYDFFLDESAAITFFILAKLTQKHKVVCPLYGGVNEFTKTWDNSDRHAIEIAEDRHLTADMLINFTCQANVSSFTHVSVPEISDSIALTSMHLLEGVVAIKTLIGLANRIRHDDDLQYLRAIRDDIPLLPDKLDPMYNLALRFFDATIGAMLVGNNPSQLRNWPDDVILRTIRNLVDISFLYVVDIALHIPPIELISQLINSGKNSRMDFLPVARFFKAIEILQQEGRFPESDEGGGIEYYQKLFNWIANKAGWPAYDETQSAWEAKLLHLRDTQRRSMSDGYRFRMLVQRRINSYDILLNPATNACASQAIPVVHLTPNGLKLLRFMGSYSAPWDMPFLPVWELVNYEAITWKNTPKDINAADAMKIEFDRYWTFLQEIATRSMCRALQMAVLKNHYFRCPWSKRGCHVVAEPICLNVTNLCDIPQHECSMRKYLASNDIHPSNITWKSGGNAQ